MFPLLKFQSRVNLKQWPDFFSLVRLPPISRQNINYAKNWGIFHWNGENLATFQVVLHTLLMYLSLFSQLVLSCRSVGSTVKMSIFLPVFWLISFRSWLHLKLKMTHFVWTKIRRKKTRQKSENKQTFDYTRKIDFEAKNSSKQ